MIAQLRERVRQWWFTRDMLLVNFGSGPGRVPLVLLSRSEVTEVAQQGAQISFSSRSSYHSGWRFTVHTKTTGAAERISYEIKRRLRHILEPLGDITCITHTRPEENETARPRIVGGDISIAGVPQSEYWRHGNGAWMLSTIFTEPDAAPNSRQPQQLPTSPDIQSPDSQRTSPAGGCG
jgi:hypothetical protein